MDEVEVVSDSELLVKQMRGEYRVKNEALRELSLAGVRASRAGSAGHATRHVRREHNELADRLVNEALDAGLSAPRLATAAILRALRGCSSVG